MDVYGNTDIDTEVQLLRHCVLYLLINIGGTEVHGRDQTRAR